MKRQPFPSNDLSTLRIVVWLAMAAATVLFWGVAAGVVISFFR